MIFVASTILLASFSMFAFPRRLPTKVRPRASQQRPINGQKTVVDNSATRKEIVVSVVRSKNPSLKDFPKAVRRLLKNDILLFRTASSVLHILPVAGLYTFLPKYFESQFRMAAHVANMISGRVCRTRIPNNIVYQFNHFCFLFIIVFDSGIGGILVMGIGIFFSGVFIRLKKPSPKFVAAWIALTALLYAMGTIFNFLWFYLKPFIT